MTGRVLALHGDARALPLPDASVSAVVTDPPYLLGFMGKEWDSRAARDHLAWHAGWAVECLRVLKPGGHLLAFGGTRTWHRLACAIEDAGFEIRDTIAYQHMKHIFCQCSPVPYSHDDVSHEGVPGVRGDVAADDPLPGGADPDVFQGVRGQGEQPREEGCYSAGEAQADDGAMRGVRGGVRDSHLPAGAGQEPDVLPPVQRDIAGPGVRHTRGQGSGRMDRRQPGQLPREDDRRTESRLEGRGDVLAEEGQLSGDQVRPGAGVGSADGPQGRVHHGASSDHGDDRGSSVAADGSGASPGPQPAEQRSGEPGALAVEWIPQGGGAWPGCPGCHKPLAPPFESGPLAWNYGSGFPKSLDVSKAIDRAAGAEREHRLVPTKPRNRPEQAGEIALGATGMTDVSPPVTDAARRWSGWGTALKPAHEPIVVARKPVVGTVAGNVQAHGTGALNIDATRVGDGGGGTRCTNRDGAGRCRGHQNAGRSTSGETVHGPNTAAGRWPPNVVLDEAAAAELDRQSGSLTSGRLDRSGITAENGIYGARPKGLTGIYEQDSGGASRFFPTFRYEGKAPAHERPRVNGVSHATVKPLALMRWLVRLVTPPGGLILDPFAGSGTTAEAAALEGFDCIAIELEPTYLPLIAERLSKPLQSVLPLAVQP